MGNFKGLSLRGLGKAEFSGASSSRIVSIVSSRGDLANGWHDLA
jgi:hypothetical protein